jgi:hypothetical protein
VLRKCPESSISLRRSFSPRSRQRRLIREGCKIGSVRRGQESQVRVDDKQCVVSGSYRVVVGGQVSQGVILWHTHIGVGRRRSLGWFCELTPGAGKRPYVPAWLFSPRSIPHRRRATLGRAQTQ